MEGTGGAGSDERSSSALCGMGRSTLGSLGAAEGAEGGKIDEGGELARLMAAMASILDFRGARLAGCEGSTLSSFGGGSGVRKGVGSGVVLGRESEPGAGMERLEVNVRARWLSEPSMSTPRRIGRLPRRPSSCVVDIVLCMAAGAGE